MGVGCQGGNEEFGLRNVVGGSVTLGVPSRMLHPRDKFWGESLGCSILEGSCTEFALCSFLE